MKEFDFRVPGLAPIRPGDPVNFARVREIRDTILSMAGGFTEIESGLLRDLLPGKGMGYIVALRSLAQAKKLQAALGAVTAKWNAGAVTMAVGERGPRKDFCFFLVPILANPDSKGKRRYLFREERWAQIDLIIQPKLSHGVTPVYGEWLSQGSRVRSTDPLRMYIVHWRSENTETFLRRFLQTRVFDGGIECDQWYLYLSIRGRSHIIAETMPRGF